MHFVTTYSPPSHPLCNLIWFHHHITSTSRSHTVLPSHFIHFITSYSSTNTSHPLNAVIIMHRPIVTLKTGLRGRQRLSLHALAYAGKRKIIVIVIHGMVCMMMGLWCIQDEGMALLNLSASPDGALYKDSITRFWGPKPQGLPYHILSHGDIVLISRHAPGWHLCGYKESRPFLCKFCHVMCLCMCMCCIRTHSATEASITMRVITQT